MQLMYVDESGGDDANASNQYFVLGGLVAFERAPFHICAEVDAIQEEFFPSATGPIEFRASAIWSGNGEPWNSMPKPERGRLMSRMYQFIANRDDLTLFAIPMHKASFASDHPMQKACEEMAGHFDRYLENFEIDKPQHGRQRGLMIFDQSKHEKTVQALLAQYRTTGPASGESSALRKYRCLLTRRLRACCNWPILLHTRSSKIMSAPMLSS